MDTQQGGPIPTLEDPAGCSEYLSCQPRTAPPGCSPGAYHWLGLQTGKGELAQAGPSSSSTSRPTLMPRPCESPPPFLAEVSAVFCPAPGHHADRISGTTYQSPSHPLPMRWHSFPLPHTNFGLWRRVASRTGSPRRPEAGTLTSYRPVPWSRPWPSDDSLEMSFQKGPSEELRWTIPATSAQ
jgi:hypothetical protein